MKPRDNESSQSPSWLVKNWTYFVIAILVITNILSALGLGRPSLTRDPKTRPAEAVSCAVDRAVASCKTTDGKLLGSFYELPTGVTPVMLSVGDEAKLRALPKDGFECLGPISAHFAFYDEAGNIVTEFATPVTFEYTLTESDINVLKKCNPDISMGNLSEVVPVYLYLPTADKFVNIWKPFQSYEVGKDGTIKIFFQFWGDPQNGIGTRPPSG